MRRMKKLLAFLLAAIMVMSMGSVSVMAATSTYTITVNSTLTGRTYVAYQLFTGDMDEGKLINVVTGDGVDVFSDAAATTEDLTKIAALTNAMKNSTEAISETLTGYKTLGELFTAALASDASAAQIANVLGTYGKLDDSVLVAFTNVVSNYLRSEGKISYTSTSNNGTTYNFEGLEAGYYLIVDESTTAGVGEAYTRYMLVMTSDSNSNTVEINSKEEVPTLTKSLSDDTDSTSATVGDTLSYKITTSIPDTTSYSSYTYQITDTLAKGLKLVENSNNTAVSGYTALDITIKVGDGDALKGIRLSGSTDTTSTTNYDYYYYTTTNTDGTTTLTIAFTDFISLVANESTTTSIVTTYTAELTSDAVIGSTGNTNTAYLTYSSNPYNSSTTSNTVKSTVTVYTYEVDLTKVDSANNSNKLSGAKFYLMDSAGNYAIVKEDTSGTDGYYTVTEWTATEADKSTLTSGTNGELYISGLGAGIYYLYESAAPTGYVTWTDSMTIEITATTAATSTTSLSATVGGTAATTDASAGTITASITNSSSSTLPTTGGLGTVMIYVLGGCMVVITSILLITKKRMAGK